MTETLFSYLAHRMLSMMQDHRDFFGKSDSDRANLCEKAKLPKSVQSYLTKVSEDQYLKDLQDTLRAIHAVGSTERTKKNGLSDAFVQYLSNEIGSLLDRIPLVFYSLPVSEKRAFLNEKTKLPEVFVDLLSGMNYQQMVDDILSFLKSYDTKTPYIVVQMARDCDQETKKEMRANFKEKYPNALPSFQVSKYLYGGMKVFVDGKVIDQSWLGKIQRFTTAL